MNVAKVKLNQYSAVVKSKFTNRRTLNSCQYLLHYVEWNSTFRCHAFCFSDVWKPELFV